VARQYLGVLGKTDNGLVAVSTLWADERVYSPLHTAPYTPASRLPGGQRDPAFRTKPRIALELVGAARAAGVPFRAVVADSFYGDNLDFEATLGQARVPYVLALKPSKGAWVREGEAETPEDAARRLRWDGPDVARARSGAWTRLGRTGRAGRTAVWWAAEARFAGYRPEGPVRLVVATTDPHRLPPRTTWYLATNLPPPGAAPAAAAPAAAAPGAPAELAEVVRLYGLRNWVEQGYKHLKHELGWGDFQVRADRAIRRHWALVSCAFAFCWRAWFGAGRLAPAWPPPPEPRVPPVPSAPPPVTVLPAPAPAGWGGKGAAAAGPASAGDAAPAASRAPVALLAGGAALRAQLAGALDRHLALLAGLALGDPAPGAPLAARPRRRRLLPPPLSPALTKYR